MSDLGKSIRPGLTNNPKNGDEGRAFGLKTEEISRKSLNENQKVAPLNFF